MMSWKWPPREGSSGCRCRWRCNAKVEGGHHLDLPGPPDLSQHSKRQHMLEEETTGLTDDLDEWTKDDMSRYFSTFLALDEFSLNISALDGFPDHPHQGIKTFTCMTIADHYNVASQISIFSTLLCGLIAWSPDKFGPMCRTAETTIEASDSSMKVSSEHPGRPCLDDGLAASYTPFQAAKQRFFTSTTALARIYTGSSSPRMDAGSSIDLCDTHDVACGARPCRGCASTYVIPTVLVVGRDYAWAPRGHGGKRPRAE